MIQEIIVVEGRDDEAAVRRAVDAEVIVTHGFGISAETYARIAEAYERQGIILFTDPDYAGEGIRRKLASRFPGAKHAFLSREAGWKEGDIGVENASPEAIRQALEKVRTETDGASPRFSMADMMQWELCGGEGAAQRRDRLGEQLGIGYGNAGAFLRRLNRYGITREEFQEAAAKL